MYSRLASARSNLRPFGVDKTGLPAYVTSAFTCPGPSVRISSANAVTGSSPANSGSPRTRLCQRAKPPRGANDSGAVSGSNAGTGNIAPPGRSKLPVTTFTLGNRYDGDVAVAHLDLHRLSTLAGEDPGLLDDYVDAATIAFVEWPEVAESELEAAVRVRLEHMGGDRRRIEVAR